MLPNASNKGPRTWRRILLFTAASFVAFLGLVEVLARVNIQREREKRFYLGDKLYVVERGQGPPVVFIAGLQGSTRYWGNAFDPLARDHRLIFVDAYGFGRSPWPLTEPTLTDHIAWLRRTLIARGATSHVTIVAHSFGTIIAANYAASYQGDVERIVLLGTPVFFGEQDARQRIRAMSDFAAMFSLNPILARETCLAMGAFRPLLLWIAPRVSSLPDPVAEDAVLHDWYSINGAIRNILLSKPISAALLRVRAATVFIHGQTDPVSPLGRVRSLALQIRAPLVIVPGDHQAYLTSGLTAVLQTVRGEDRLPSRYAPGHRTD